MAPSLENKEPTGPIDPTLLSINHARAEEFLKSLDNRPKDRMVFVYQAIIVSLIAHIFILFVTQMLTQDHRAAKEEVLYEELAMDMLDEEALPEEIKPQDQQMRSEELRNLVTNENSERSSDARSYRGMSSSQMKEQAFNDLKNMEAEEFARLKNGESDYTVADKTQGQGKASHKKKSDMDWYREQQNNKSYNGPVTASFNMIGRDPLENPIPTYRCKTNGKVVVLVSIDELGKVIEARISEGASSVNECLRSESLTYAKKWRFDYNNKSRKQDGTITFTFSAQ